MRPVFLELVTQCKEPVVPNAMALPLPPHADCTGAGGAATEREKWLFLFSWAWKLFYLHFFLHEKEYLAPRVCSLWLGEENWKLVKSWRDKKKPVMAADRKKKIY